MKHKRIQVCLMHMLVLGYAQNKAKHESFMHKVSLVFQYEAKSLSSSNFTHSRHV